MSGLNPSAPIAARVTAATAALTALLVLSMLSLWSPVSASALTQWTHPVTISQRGANDYHPKVAVSPATGVATVVWEDDSTHSPLIQFVQIAANGLVGPVRLLSANAGGPEVAVDPATGVITFVWVQATVDGGGVVQALQVAANGAVGPVQSLSILGQGVSDPQVVVSPATGVATVAWMSNDMYHGQGDEVIQAAQIAADGTVGPARTLSAEGGGAWHEQVAVDPATGIATVVWEYLYTSIQAARLAADGTVGPVEQLSAPGESSTVAPKVAADAVSGVTTVVWSRQVTPGGGNYNTEMVQIAANGTVGARKNLGVATQWGVPVAVNPTNGLVAVLWYASNHGCESRTQMKALGVSADGTVGTATNLPMDVAVASINPNNGLLIAVGGGLSCVNQQTNSLYALQFAANGKGGTVPVSSAARIGSGEEPQIAVDPKGGVATVVWAKSNYHGSLTPEEGLGPGPGGDIQFSQSRRATTMAPRIARLKIKRVSSAKGRAFRLSYTLSARSTVTVKVRRRLRVVRQHKATVIYQGILNASWRGKRGNNVALVAARQSPGGLDCATLTATNSGGASSAEVCFRA
jgi:hypothetical protein